MSKRHALFVPSQDLRLCVESSEAVLRKHDEDGCEDSVPPTCALVGVPGEYSVDDLLVFVGAYAADIAETVLLPTAALDYQLALLRFSSAEAMGMFMQLFSFQHFPAEDAFDQICVVIPLSQVNFGESADHVIGAMAGSPSALSERWKALPLCPYCLGRLSESFNGIPDSNVAVPLILTPATRRRCRVCQLLYSHLRGEEVQCNRCGLLGNVWACLLCGNCGCGRESIPRSKSHPLRLLLPPTRQGAL